MSNKKRNYKIFSISDIHLRTLKSHESYQIMFNNVLNALEKEKPHYMIINGDLFHNKLISSNEANIMMGNFLSSCTEFVQEKVIINIGNHDFVIGSKRLDTVTPIIKMINNPKLILIPNSGCMKTDDNNIVWCTWSLFDENQSPRVKEWKEENDPNGENIYVGLYHGIVSGSKTKNYSFDEGGLSLGDPDVFELDHLNCGDIHLFEKRTFDNYKGVDKGLYIMNSSTIQQDFGEFVDQHGYNVLFYDAVTDTWEHDLHEIPNDYTYNVIELNDFEELENLVIKERITEKSKIRVDWKERTENMTNIREKEIEKFLKLKYGVAKVSFKKIPTNKIKLGEVEFKDGEVGSVNSPETQNALMENYLKDNKCDVEISDILRLNKRVEEHLNEVEARDTKWKIKCLRVTNFLSYGDETVFDFEKLKGITLINGANFAGKTTVANAITWLLFGETEKAKKLEDVINKFNDATFAKVEGDLEIDGKVYRIVREVTRKYVKKTDSYNGVSSSIQFLVQNEEGVFTEEEKDESNETKKKIKEYVGNMEDFLRTIMCTGDNIFDVIKTKPTERGEVLSKYLGLEIFKRKLEKTKEMYKEWKIKADVGKHSSVDIQENIKLNEEQKLELATQRVQIEKEYNELDVADKLLKEQLNTLTMKLHKDIDSELASKDENYFNTKISEATTYINNKKIELSTLKGSLKTDIEEFNESKYKENLDLINFKQSEIDTIKNEYNHHLTKINNANNNIKTLELEISYLKREMETLRTVIGSLKGNKCPECKQNLCDDSHKLTIDEKIKEGVAKKGEVESKTKEIETTKLLIEELNLQTPSFGTKIDSINEEINKIKLDNEEINKVKELVTKNDIIKLNIDKVEVEIEIGHTKLEKETTLFEKFKLDKEKILENLSTKESINYKQMDITSSEEKLRSKQNAITTIDINTKDLTSKNEELDKLLTKIRREEHTSKVFDVYMAMVGKDGISKSILKSTVPVLNQELSNLLSDSAEFKVEIEINEKNNEVEFWLVDNSTGVKNTLFSGSGYEQTIASLAIRVVNSKVNTLPKPSLMIVDEIFSTVQNENMELVKLFIDKVAEDLNNIILITHNEMTKDWADNIITVTKENKVSKVSF